MKTCKRVRSRGLKSSRLESCIQYLACIWQTKTCRILQSSTNNIIHYGYRHFSIYSVFTSLLGEITSAVLKVHVWSCSVCALMRNRVKQQVSCEVSSRLNRYSSNGWEEMATEWPDSNLYHRGLANPREEGQTGTQEGTVGNWLQLRLELLWHVAYRLGWAADAQQLSNCHCSQRGSFWCHEETFTDVCIFILHLSSTIFLVCITGNINETAHSLCFVNLFRSFQC